MSASYSFMDVVASLVGPGGSVSLGNGSAAAEEGIDIIPAGDKSTMMIGADGAGIHSLHADKSGQVTVRFLKNSPTNQLLSALYAFQTASSSSHGQNTIAIYDKSRGDTIVCTQCAFRKAPDIKYAKDADVIAWEFDAVKIERTLGS
jgi:hypothetical protein